MFERGSRRGPIYPRDVENSGPTFKGPDTPQPEVTQLKELGRFFQRGKTRHPQGLEVSQSTTISNGSTVVNGNVVIPLEKQSLTPVFYTRFGGGRVGGGGTSEKSLSTAKKNARRQKK